MADEPSLSELILYKTLIKTEIKTEPEPQLEEPFIEAENENLQFDAPDFVRIENSETVEGHFRCPECKKIFAEQPLLDLHSVIHKFLHKKIQACPICDKEYTTFRPFKTHIEEHLMQFFKCPFCPEFFFSFKKHVSHVSQHKKNEKLFPCSYCDKKFHSPKEKKVHERVHTNERPYLCLICKKGFKQTGSLRAHINNVHNERKDHKCEKCDGFFATSSSLHRHERKIHDEGKSIPCKLCGAIFYNYDAFYKHKTESHLETRFFKMCPVCNEPFFSKKMYTAHGRTHPNWKEKVRERQRSLMESKPKRDKLSMSDSEEIIEDQVERSVVKSETIIDEDENEIESLSHFLEPSNETPQEEPPVKIKVKTEILENTSLKRIKKETEKEQNTNARDKRKTKLGAKKAAVKRRKGAKTEIAGSEETSIHKIKQEEYSDFDKETYNEDEEHVTANSAIKCMYCDEMFVNRADCDLHHTVHTFDNTVVTYCPVCNKSFTLLRYYAEHIHKHIQVKMLNDAKNPLEYENSTVDRKIECPECQQIFPNKGLYDLHYTIHTFDSDEGIRCSCCFKKFITCKNYSLHIQKHIEEKMGNSSQSIQVKTESEPALTTSVACSHCGEEFSHEEILDFHATIHNPGKVMKCRFCFKTYINIVFYTEHVRNHISACESCKICSSVFFNKRDFTAHMKTHNITCGKFQCRHCPRKFPKKYKRAAHECQVHKVDNGKRFQCPRCFKEFYEMGTFHVHVRYVYTCQDCKQVFCKIETLNRHRAAEHPPDRLRCKKCEIVFRDEREYRLHFLEHHSQSLSQFILAQNQATSGGSYSEDAADEDLSTMETEYELERIQASFPPGKSFSLSLSSSESTSESLSPDKKHFLSKTTEQNVEEFEPEKNSYEMNPYLEEAGSSKGGDTGETDIGYKCDQCGKKFSRIIYFKKHMQNHLFLKDLDLQVNGVR